MNFFFYIARQCDNGMYILTYLLLLIMKASTYIHEFLSLYHQN